MVMMCEEERLARSDVFGQLDMDRANIIRLQINGG